MKRSGLTIIALALFLGGALRPARAASPMTDLVDIPTAEAVDHYGYNLSFRFYSQGGLLGKTSFGVLPRLNLGFGLDTEKFIGSQTVDLNRPTLNFKFRFFDGKRQLPAFALGYDSQGYFYDHNAEEYSQREKGLYLVGSGEVIVPHMYLHGGLNVYDFSDDHVYVFSGINYVYEDTVALMYEADNIYKARHIRHNAGLRYFVTTSFAVDVAGRGLWAAGQKAERIVRLIYTGSF